MSKNWTIENIPDQTGKRVIVTGANTGIGFEMARVLADKGAEVILACRNSDKADTAVARILSENPVAKVLQMPLDLSSLDSVRRFTGTFLSKYETLDILINNAGIMMPPLQRTADGFESQFGTNYLGHFLLTGLLHGLINKTPHGRIVTLSSTAHHMGKIDFDNLNAEKHYNKQQAYYQSKLACVMFSHELQRRLKNDHLSSISVAAHPGASTTDLMRHSLLMKIIFCWAQSPVDGAMPALRAATAPEVKGGEYYGPGGFLKFKGDSLSGPPVVGNSSDLSSDKVIAKQLWNASQELVGYSYL
jgi:NAD(P)-dependent dehydrogenase (short-subunit alcohol dehydrogenase family)